MDLKVVVLTLILSTIHCEGRRLSKDHVRDILKELDKIEADVEDLENDAPIDSSDYYENSTDNGNWYNPFNYNTTDNGFGNENENNNSLWEPYGHENSTGNTNSGWSPYGHEYNNSNPFNGHNAYNMTDNGFGNENESNNSFWEPYGHEYNNSNPFNGHNAYNMTDNGFGNENESNNSFWESFGHENNNSNSFYGHNANNTTDNGFGNENSAENNNSSWQHHSTEYINSRTNKPYSRWQRYSTNKPYSGWQHYSTNKPYSRWQRYSTNKPYPSYTGSWKPSTTPSSYSTNHKPKEASILHQCSSHSGKDTCNFNGFWMVTTTDAECKDIIPSCKTAILKYPYLCMTKRVCDRSCGNCRIESYMYSYSFGYQTAAITMKLDDDEFKYPFCKKKSNVRFCAVLVYRRRRYIQKKPVNGRYQICVKEVYKGQKKCSNVNEKKRITRGGWDIIKKDIRVRCNVDQEIIYDFDGSNYKLHVHSVRLYDGKCKDVYGGYA